MSVYVETVRLHWLLIYVEPKLTIKTESECLGDYDQVVILFWIAFCMSGHLL